MSQKYSIDTSDGIVAVCFAKDAETEDIRRAIAEVAGHYPSDLRLWNISSEGINLTSSQIRKLASYGRSRFMMPSKVAIVAREDLAYGLSRMYEAYKSETGPAEIKFFRSEQEARVWLTNQGDNLHVH